MDTPGMLWPKFEDPEVGFRLACTGAVRDEIVDLEELASRLMAYLGRRYPQALLDRYKVTNVEVEDISREAGAMMRNIGTISLTKGITFDVDGTPRDTSVVCVVRPADPADTIDRQTLSRWLRIRTKVDNLKLFVEP